MQLRANRPLVVGFSLLALAILALIVVVARACGANGGPEPTATPTETTPPTATMTPTLVPPPQTSYRLVYQERGATEDIIWSVNPADLSQKQDVARIQHRDGFSIEPSLSPDGTQLAYVALPDDATDSSYQGELYVYDLKRQETELIAMGVDLHFRPLWAPDSKLLYVRRFVGQQVAVLQIVITRKLAPGEEAPGPTQMPPTDQNAATTPTPSSVDQVKTILFANFGTILTFTPVGFADDNKSMYFVQVHGGTGGGTSVAVYSPATSEAIAEVTPTASAPPDSSLPDATPTPTYLFGSFVVQLSDQVIRDFDFSPDRKRFAYLVQELTESGFVTHAFVADLEAKSTAPVPTGHLPAGDHLHPVWHPDGAHLTLGILPGEGHDGAVAIVAPDGSVASFLTAPPIGFDVPIAWTPDEAYLAVDSFNGSSLANPGSRELVLLSAAGHRTNVAEGEDSQFVAWFQPE